MCVVGDGTQAELGEGGTNEQPFEETADWMKVYHPVPVIAVTAILNLDQLLSSRLAF